MWKLIPNLFAHDSARVPPATTVRLAVEGLERRDVCSVNYSLAGNVLTVTGNQDRDEVYVGVRDDVIYISHRSAPQGTESWQADPQVAIPRGGRTLSQVVFDGKDGDDIFYALTEDVRVYAKGGAGNDYLVGGNLPDVLSGDDGHDSLFGSRGNDTLYGGAGNDHLADIDPYVFFTVTGDNVMNGGDGDDTIDGGFGNDTIDGGDGSDSLRGGAGNDVLFGGAGMDTLNGGDGDDTLDGGLDGCADILTGGNGIDRFVKERATRQVGAWVIPYNLDEPEDFTYGTDILVIPT